MAQIERELLPSDPAAALQLAEAFIQSDRSFFERADDSDGGIGSAVAAACRLWLRAAAQCESPIDEWPARIHGLASEDDYGARDALLRESGILLDQGGLGELARLYEQVSTQRLAAGPNRGALPTETFSFSGALSVLSDALRDPDLRVRSVLAYSPQPNPLQVQEFAAAYVRHGRPADAVRWLEGASWKAHEGSRQRLLVDALRALDRRSESALIRRQLFEKSLAVSDLHGWLDDLAPSDHPAAMQHARELALRSGEAVEAAGLLLELGDDALAETVLVEGEAGVRARDYTVLVPLARELDRRECWRGATSVYRALLDGALARAYSPAYPHAAKYWVRLQAIAGRWVDLNPLQAHAAYAGEIQKQHARKARFWACVAEAAATACASSSVGVVQLFDGTRIRPTAAGTCRL